MQPADVQLRRIALFLGLPDAKPVQTSKPRRLEDVLREAQAAGLPIVEGRPDDPMLDLLDL